MKLLLDFLPILIFFGVYKTTGDLITATAVLIPVTIVQVAVVYWLTKTVEKMALVTLALVVVLGGLTVLLNDGWFIMWKPTVVNWLFAAAFFGSHFIGNRPIIERLLGHAISLNHSPLAQALVCLDRVFYRFRNRKSRCGLSILGRSVGQLSSSSACLGLTFVFLIIQGVWISRHGSEVTPNAEEKTDA